MHVEPVGDLKGVVKPSGKNKCLNDGVKCVAVGDDGEQEREGQEDWRNVDTLSDLFSLMEGEEVLGADFGVFFEDQDIHAEEVGDIFSAMEDANRSSSELDIVLPGDALESPADVEDARVVDEFADLFSSLERAEALESSKDDAADAENVDAMSAVFSQLEEQDTADADNVDAMSELFTELEQQEVAASADAANVDAMSELFTELEGAEMQVEEANPSAGSDQDWIDSLEVDNVASLFAELEEAADSPPTKVDAKVNTKVDARIFVPMFAVRIEGKPVSHPHSLLSTSTTMLVGPPRSAPRHCPPPLPSRAESVGRWKEKRKARSFAARPTDPTISDTRRACAAKRQRVKGRFAAEKHGFVSITSLQ
jgi:hypothetical protein